MIIKSLNEYSVEIGDNGRGYYDNRKQKIEQTGGGGQAGAILDAIKAIYKALPKDARSYWGQIQKDANFSAMDISIDDSGVVTIFDEAGNQVFSQKMQGLQGTMKNM